MGDKYLYHLEHVAKEDVEGLKEAHKHYGSSCLKRGGTGLWMMLARKIDRIENTLAPQTIEVDGQKMSRDQAFDYAMKRLSNVEEGLTRGDRTALAEVLQKLRKEPYDILQGIAQDQRAEGLIDDIRDLRRYLMIVEAEARAMQLPSALSKSRDNLPGGVVATNKDGTPTESVNVAGGGVVHYGAMRELIVALYEKYQENAKSGDDLYSMVTEELRSRKIEVTRTSVKMTLIAHMYNGKGPAATFTDEPGPDTPVLAPLAVLGDTAQPAPETKADTPTPHGLASPPYSPSAPPRRPMPERMVPRRPPAQEQEHPFGFSPEQDVA